jgi:hypothetical protein
MVNCQFPESDPLGCGLVEALLPPHDESIIVIVISVAATSKTRGALT